MKNSPRLPGALLCLLPACVSLIMPFPLGSAQPVDQDPVRVLFLGDNGPHQPAERFKQLQPGLSSRGIELDYSASVADLSRAKLAGYDVVLVYANHTRIEPEPEAA